MNQQEAVELLGGALQENHLGYLRYCGVMARPGMAFSRWQMFRLRFWLRFGKVWRAQRIILGLLEDDR